MFSSWDYAGIITVNPSLDVVKIVVIEKTKQLFFGRSCLSGTYSLLMEYEGSKSSLPHCKQHGGYNGN